MGKLSINTSNVNMVTKNDVGEKNVNSCEGSKNNHSGGLTSLVVNGSNGMGNGNGSSVRASTVYDICHPLVM